MFRVERIYICGRREVNLEQVRLTGKQVVVRDWRLVDLKSWGEWLKPPRRWQEFDGPYYPQPTPGQIYKMLERTQEQITRSSWSEPRAHLVIAERASDKLIGRVLWHWESEETFWPQVGIVIFDDALWGKGCGFEALGLWSEYLFENLPDIVRLDLRTWSGNAGMMRLAEKAGYRLEARFRKARIVKGDYFDGLGYGVLREEWQALYPEGFRAAL